MSVQIRLNSWSGDDKQDAVARLSKMFKMPMDEASNAVKDVSGGSGWKFGKPLSDSQAQTAKSYLERLGFSVELISPQAAPAPVDDFPEQESVSPPPKEKKSFFSFLFKGKKGDKKKEAPGKSLFGVGGAKAEETETPAFQESAPAAPEAPAKKAPKSKDKAKSSPVAAVLLLVILAACAGLPYWFGMQARTLFDESLASISQHGMTAQMTSYEQGWLSSNAEFTLRGSGSPTMKAQSVITHGPFAYADWIQGDLNFKPFQAKIDSTLNVSTQGLGDVGKIPEIKVVTWAPLAGDWTADVSMPPTKKKLDKGVEVDWQGLSGSFHFPADLQALKGDLSFGPLAIKSKKDEIRLDNILYNQDIFTGQAGLNLGSGSMAINKISFSDSKAKGSVADVKLTGMSKEEGPNIASDFSFQTGKIDLGGENVYGPTVFNMTARNLDALALAQLGKLAESQTSGGKNASKMQEQALKIFAQITKKKPEFQVSRLSFQTPYGEVQGHVKMVLDGTKADISQNPFAVLTILDVDAWLLLPKIFVGSVVSESGLPGMSAKGKKSKPMSPKQIAQAINKLEANNVMVADGENYKITFTFKDGKPLLNGKPLDSKKLRLF